MGEPAPVLSSPGTFWERRAAEFDAQRLLLRHDARFRRSCRVCVLTMYACQICGLVVSMFHRRLGLAGEGTCVLVMAVAAVWVSVRQYRFQTRRVRAVLAGGPLVLPTASPPAKPLVFWPHR